MHNPDGLFLEKSYGTTKIYSKKKNKAKKTNQKKKSTDRYNKSIKGNYKYGKKKYTNAGNKENTPNGAGSVGSAHDRTRDACRLSCVDKLVHNMFKLNIDSYVKLIWFIFKSAYIDQLYKQKITNLPNRNDDDLVKIVLHISTYMDDEYKTTIERVIREPISRKSKITANVKLINDSTTNLIDNFNE